jgi:hypothetical protein
MKRLVLLSLLFTLLAPAAAARAELLRMQQTLFGMD